jgi:hypothetical protein
VPLILFDQNVPRALGPLLTGHSIRTAVEQGGEELTNGDLLSAASALGFSILVTADQNIIHQQDTRARPVRLVVLSTNHWPTLRGNADRILQAIDRLEPTGYAYVACGLPPKRRRSVPRAQV